MFSAASVCLSVCSFPCVCLFVNTINLDFGTSIHRIIKLGGRCIVQKIWAEFEFGGHSPLGVHPAKVCRWDTTLGMSAQVVVV